MVRALLEGRKTQTRRVVKLKHLDISEVGAIHPDGSGRGWIAWQPGMGVTAEFTKEAYPGNRGFACPYGAGSDVLWVRETFGIIQPTHATPGGKPYDGSFVYRADGDDNPSWAEGTFEFSGWKPSIHMPKSACRIFLQITDIRVERLQDISEADAKAEGVLMTNSGDSGIGGVWYKDYLTDARGYGHPDHDFPIVSSPIESFASLWKKINGAESWEGDPWVWAITFTRIDKPENF